MGYAESVFKLSLTDDKGISKFEHLQQVEFATGKTPIELQIEPLPRELLYIWEMFLDISRGRSSGFSGPNPLSYQEIQSWSYLTGIKIASFEVSLIRQLDQAFVRINNGSV